MAADFSLVLLGCTRGNAVPLTLGAGQGSKSASLCTRSSTCRKTMLTSLRAHQCSLRRSTIMSNTHPSWDATTYDRIAKYFCQRVINHSAMELEGEQATEIFLGERSAGSSDALVYFSGWDIQWLARIAAAGHASDVNFSNEEAHDVNDNADNYIVELQPAIPTDPNDEFHEFWHNWSAKQVKPSAWQGVRWLCAGVQELAKWKCASIDSALLHASWFKPTAILCLRICADLYRSGDDHKR
jgi:hypothetical protein